MEFPFNVDKILPGKITVIESKECNGDLQIYSLDRQDENQMIDANWIYRSSANAPWDLNFKKKKEYLASLIDQLGYASAQAQNLQTPITSFRKLLNSSQQKLYVVRELEKPRCVIGLLKVGVKRLFVSNSHGAQQEVDSLCVLDFYVHESKQRGGFGHELFNAMLLAENITPEKLAVDRPSYKCLQFLQKHYNLKQPVPQNNNYVIYPGFLDDRPVTRPPIFLYRGKVVKNSSSKVKQVPTNNFNEAKALEVVTVPLNAPEMKKNKTFCSSVGNCLTWNGDGDSETLRTTTQKLITNSCRRGNITARIEAEKHRGVNEAMHRYLPDNGLDDWNDDHSARSLTPVNSVTRCSKKKWDQLQSSWNILGVKPVDYSVFEK